MTLTIPDDVTYLSEELRYAEIQLKRWKQAAADESHDGAQRRAAERTAIHFAEECAKWRTRLSAARKRLENKRGSYAARRPVL